MAKMTTIKLSIETKERLDQLKEHTDTYERIISKLAKKYALEQQLIEGYKANAQENLRLAKEWEETLGDGL